MAADRKLGVDAAAGVLAAPLLDWLDRHGGRELPWRQDRTPYRVWVSEIMLQQTRAATVILYYQRFMERFPSLDDLANAEVDEVLHHWSGLGYYSRARNLHRTAVLIQDRHRGQFPQRLEQLTALPGIGRSTAGAILSLASGQRQAILDGNVKRVLSRYYLVEGWPAQGETLRQLWQLAEQNTPQRRTADYNQAIMELGASLCSRSNPDCPRCPLRAGCRANLAGAQQLFPGRKPVRMRPEKHTHLLLLRNADGDYLLEKRPPAGIWGGLWSCPESTLDENELPDWCARQYGLLVRQPTSLQPVRHVFTHFRLTITPWHCDVRPAEDRVMESANLLWYNLRQPQRIGLARPVMNLLHSLHTTHPTPA